MSLTGQLVWDRGCPLAVNTVANGIGEGVATGSVNGVPNPEVRFDVRVQAQIGPTPGGGFTYPVTPTTRGGLRVIIVTNYFAGGDLVEFDVIFGNDPADSSPLPGGNVASPLRGVCTASYEVTEQVDPGDPAFGTRTRRFSMTVGPLYRCTYPQGGGGGGDSLLLSAGGGSGGGSGGGGCSGCGGGIA